MAGTPGRPVQARIRTPCRNLGFVTPPCEVHLRFLLSRAHWVLYAFAPQGTREQLRAWLDAYGPSLVQHSTSSPSVVLRATFPTLPPAWTQMLEDFEVRDMRIHPDGTAVLIVEGERDRFTHGPFHDVEAVFDVEQARAKASLLTSLQHRTILDAFNAGYYDVPKRINLAELAATLGTSQAALSELLRRGEERLIARYVLMQTDLPRDAFDEAATWSDGGQAYSTPGPGSRIASGLVPGGRQREAPGGPKPLGSDLRG